MESPIRLRSAIERLEYLQNKQRDVTTMAPSPNEEVLEAVLDAVLIVMYEIEDMREKASND
jgi:hypothetical protein